MQLVFTLRPGYEDVSGSVQYGSSGETFQFPDDLTEGSVTTENPYLQAALRELQGAGGRIFDVTTESGEAWEAPLPGATAEPQAPPEGVQASTGESTGSAPPPDTPAQHGDGSTYEGLTRAELTEEARNRGLDIQSGASKSELVTALEAHDAEGGTSDGS